MFDWSSSKVAVIWAGVVLTLVAFMVPLTLMVNHYNDQLARVGIACVQQGGTFANGSCTWSKP